MPEYPLNETEFASLCDLFFNPNYAGYKEDVVESPNGDGVWDDKKQYCHINWEYLSAEHEKMEEGNSIFSHEQISEFMQMLVRLNEKARGVAMKMGVSPELLPSAKYSTIRLIKYPPEAVSAPHKDFDLFTMMLYRNIPECFQYDYSELSGHNDPWLNKFAHQFPQIHFGEMLEIVNPKIFKATTHRVDADSWGRWQYSAVLFAIPDHDAKLKEDLTVGQFLEERLARSRTYV